MELKYKANMLVAKFGHFHAAKFIYGPTVEENFAFICQVEGT